MIREMKKQDFKKMMDIYSQSIKKATITFASNCPTFEEWNDSHLKECRFVYEDNDEIIGYTIIAPTSKMQAYKGVVELSIFVDENHLHEGIGTKLMNHLINETKKHGYWCLYSVICSVNTPSINLHLKCGFRIIGEREDIAKDINGVWQSTTILERRNDIK